MPWAGVWANDPNQTVAAHELFGALIDLKLFRRPEDSGTRGVAVVTGATDHQGNAYAVQKATSTGYLLALLRRELSEEMCDQQVAADLRGKPWEENQEADDLVNMKVDGFSPDMKIRAGPGTVKFLVLDVLMEASPKLHEQAGQSGRRGPRAARAPRRSPAAVSLARSSRPGELDQGLGPRPRLGPRAVSA